MTGDRLFLSGRAATAYPEPMPYIEERVDTVESDIAEIKDRLGVIERSVGSMEKTVALMRDDVAELKAGQVEIRDLLARVVARLEGVQP